MDNKISTHLNDIFEPETNQPKESKSQKKKEQKKQKKESRKKKREEEAFEKKEDLEFQKMKEKEKELENSIPELYLTQVEDSFLKEKEEKPRKKESSRTTSRLEMTRNIELPQKEKIGFFSMVYDTIFGFFLIFMLLVSLGYVCFTIYSDEGKKQILTNLFLFSGIFFYVISMTVKKENVKKTFAILSSICLSSFVGLTLYFN